jgi:serine/threonine-protein kinase ULK/ATG1
MRALRHPNIVQLYDVVEDPPGVRLYLVMELCSGGDLADALRRAGPLGEATAGALLRQLAAGLRALAEGHLVHRDLKPGNLLLSGPLGAARPPALKIADFGFARVVEPARLAATLCGSPLYMAPEVREGVCVWGGGGGGGA